MFTFSLWPLIVFSNVLTTKYDRDSNSMYIVWSHEAVGFFVYFSLLIVKQIFVELCLLPMAIAGPYPSHVLPPMNAEIVSKNDFQVTSIH